MLTSEHDSIAGAVNITILETSYSVYTHVHHNYGLNDAFDRSVAHLLTAQQSHQLDDVSASALQDSVQQEPLAQDDNAVTREADAEAAGGRRLTSDGSLHADAATEREAAEGRWQASDASLPANAAAVSEAAGGRQLASDESLPANAAAVQEAAEGRKLDHIESSPAASAAERIRLRSLRSNLERHTK